MNKKLRIFLVFLQLFLAAFSHAQSSKPKSKITGSIGLYADFYKLKSDTIGAVKPRRPSFLGRSTANFTYTRGYFSLPFTMSVSNVQKSNIISAPEARSGNLLQDYKNIISNPLNRIGIAPKYKWAQLLLGSQIPSYSALSMGDLAVFGAGIALSPGKFRLTAFAGKSQMAINPDTARKIAGVYSRFLYSLKIGLGHEDSTHIYFITNLMKDDTNSITGKPLNALPQHGLLSSIDFRKSLLPGLYVKGEIAASAFTRNQYSSESENFTPALPRILFIPKASTRMDYAAVATFGYENKKFGIKTTGKYIGDGFVSVGYPFMQTDRMDITIDPKFRLYKGKVIFTGAVGKRVNNLSGIRGTTSMQTIGNADLNIQFNDAFSISAGFSNFGFRNNQTNDTLKVEMVTNTWSISPAYTLTTDMGNHNFMALYSQNAFTDFNTISGVLNNNDAQNAVFSYLFTGLKKPFSVNTILSYFNNNISMGKLQTNAINLLFGYAFYKKKLKTNLGLTLANNTFNKVDNGVQTLLSLGAKYKLKKKLNLGVTGSLNLYKYGVTRPGISYKENYLRTFITYQF